MCLSSLTNFVVGPLAASDEESRKLLGVGKDIFC